MLMPPVEARQDCAPFQRLNFDALNHRAESFADLLESRFERFVEILLEYESLEVVQDETARTLDLLRSLKENEDYFHLRIGEVASFLPRNQPLYALTCGVVVPSLMASVVHFRIPQAMRRFFPRLLRAIELTTLFPNIEPSEQERQPFLRARSGVRVDARTGESRPVTDAVIFTGAPHEAERLRGVFDSRTLFIANGAGHNPLIVAEDADVSLAAEAALSLQLYNQGQDCSAPNAVLVHRRVLEPFVRLVRAGVQQVRTGPYADRSCRVGPISEPADLKRIQALLVDHREWLDPATPGVAAAATGIVEPAIVRKPLNEGGNFTEVFAPIMFVQEYEEDSELARYFDDPRYAPHAMFVSLYGASGYVDSLVGRRFAGRVLHDAASILRRRHPRSPGVERGTQPYGGYGRFASSISINGRSVAKPTLPQRDIHEHLVRPCLADRKPGARAGGAIRARTTTVPRREPAQVPDASPEKASPDRSEAYVDCLDLAGGGRRFVAPGPGRIVSLLLRPNAAQIAALTPERKAQVRVLRNVLRRERAASVEELDAALRAAAGADPGFFRDLYQLLLARDSGPRLGPFLFDVNRPLVLSLLNV